MADTQVPAKCPQCGQLTVNNARHCKPKDEPGNAEFWARNCLTMSCRCGITYAAHGHHPRQAVS